MDKLRLTAIQLILVLSTAFVLLYNTSFWQAVFKLHDIFSLKDVLFISSLFLSLVCFFNIVFSCFIVRYLGKPFIILLLLASASATYFMGTYGVVFDDIMVQNIMETDTLEAIDLLSWKLFFYVIGLGVIPSILVYRMDIQYKSFFRELFRRLLVIICCVIVVGMLLFISYKDYVSLFRNNHYIRHLIIPMDYLYSLGIYFTDARHVSNEVTTVKKIAMDAKLGSSWKNKKKKTVVVLVVGEAARAKNFSLNGYIKETNPKLKQEDIINFSNTYSCGTSTAVSVPCMFSHFPRNDYNDNAAKTHEGLLDVLSRVGINVQWRENNSGCKGTCDRVDTKEMANMKLKDLCTSRECYDEVMLHKLQEYIDNVGSNGETKTSVIVLHQKGSHGPAYYLRYPEKFNIFSPTCKTNQLQKCTQEEISNVYDNTLLYTDYFLSKVIGFLKNNSEQYDSAMIYMSDHGQSLGENNIYLHGLPYLIAPEEQKHIPFVTWFSKDFMNNFGIERKCIGKKHDQRLSHDNLFHSVLGLLNIETSTYNNKLDIFSDCRS